METKNPPYCPDCASKGELRNAGIFSDIPFWYCTNCKKEIKIIKVTDDYKDYFEDFEII